jgi:hypothetical protein
VGEPSLGARLFIRVIVAFDPRREEVRHPTSHGDVDFKFVALITPALDADVRKIMVNRSPWDQRVLSRPVEGRAKVDV